MIDNVESIVLIVSSIVITTLTTISSIYSLQRSFRSHLESLLLDHDTKLRAWITDTFEEYYVPMDERLKHHHLRIKEIEKKCEFLG